MNSGSTNGTSKTKIVGGIVEANEKEITIPPEMTLEKFLDTLDENMLELVVHKNTRELLEKLEGHQK